MTDYLDITYKKFKPLGERLKKIREEKKLIKIGIPVVDEPLGGILENDFIVLGSATGYGKTQLVTNISNSIASQIEKNVLFFSLESYQGEIEDRILFNEIKTIWYKENTDYLDFKKWYCGKYKNSYFADYEIRAGKAISEKSKKNLLIRYKDKHDYTIHDFLKDVDSVNVFKDIGFMVIDHLHYFSFPDKESENRATKEVINKLRDTALQLNVPVILVSHLRKLDKKTKTIVPMIEDFHGSSEITKNPTAVLIINPAFDVESNKINHFPTYFHFAKNRFDGTLSRYLLLCSYNLETGKYEKEYKVYNLIKNGTDKKEVEKSLHWAKSIKITGAYEKKYGK